jgi:hypothetical protein
MQTITLVHPDRLDPAILPENGPVGSIAPFSAFTDPAYAGYKDKAGNGAFKLRDGFGGRDFSPMKMAAIALGLIPPPSRSLDMEAALDHANIDRSEILFEILKGELNWRDPESTPHFDAQQTTSTDQIETLDGYWIATWSIQDDPDRVETRSLNLVRVL